MLPGDRAGNKHPYFLNVFQLLFPLSRSTLIPLGPEAERESITSVTAANKLACQPVIVQEPIHHSNLPLYQAFKLETIGANRPSPDMLSNSQKKSGQDTQ